MNMKIKINVTACMDIIETSNSEENKTAEDLRSRLARVTAERNNLQEAIDLHNGRW